MIDILFSTKEEHITFLFPSLETVWFQHLFHGCKIANIVSKIL